jgi:hypothetical protein
LAGAKIEERLITIIFKKGESNMRHLFIFLAIFSLVATGGGPAGAVSVLFDNGTNVLPYSGTLPTGGNWLDVIEDAAQQEFKSYGAQLDVAGGKVFLTMYTEFGGANRSFNNAIVADLFIKANSASPVAFDTAVSIRSGTPTVGGMLTGDFTNNYYNITNLNLQPTTGNSTGSQVYSSIEKSASTPGTYGGRYGGSGAYVTGTAANFPLAPVEVINRADSNRAGTTKVTWASGNFSWFDGNSTINNIGYKVTVDLTSIMPTGFDPTVDNYAFLWATGTCANDTIEGSKAAGNVVPLPGALLLLGAGLARLTAYARKRKVEA